MKDNYLINRNTALNELLFHHAAVLSNNDCDILFNKLIDSGLDNNSLGFWIWNIEMNVELYSPTFRKTLGYENEIDFPNVPDSWINAIIPEDKIIAIENYNRHVESKGENRYIQKVTYNKKHRGQVTIICHGMIVHWKDQEPKIMIGVHLPE